MAAVAATADMRIQKNSQILVHVEEALADLIVVSFCADDRKFQGVLLDSKKGNLPFGVYSLHPAFSKQTVPADINDDKLHSASQRFLYEDPDYDIKLAQKKKPGPKSKAQPRQKMTVRLRPRKVLCSNCKGICNENNENVDVSKKRKLESDDDTPRDSDSRRVQKKYLMGGMLIPKLSRLQPSEISDAIKGVSKNSNKSVKQSEKSDNESEAPKLTFVSVSDGDNESRNTKNDDSSYSGMFSSARTLKICFGEGEGTVVKIPPLAGDYNEDSGVSCDMKPESKAAKKALKKAKKQAKKNSVQTRNISKSPKHVGALSPRNVSDSLALDPFEKRHKHKIKHKKKYKPSKKRDENSTKSVETIDYFSDIKEHCMTQKLSISLRRLSNSFETQDDNIQSSDEEVPEFPTDSTDVIRFNKKKKGPYKEAVKQATIEAQQNESPTDPLASPVHLSLSPRPVEASRAHLSYSPRPAEVSPAHLAHSPRPVDASSAHLSHSLRPAEASPTHLSHSPRPVEASPAHLAHSPRPVDVLS